MPNGDQVDVYGETLANIWNLFLAEAEWLSRRVQTERRRAAWTNTEAQLETLGNWDDRTGIDLEEWAA